MRRRTPQSKVGIDLRSCFARNVRHLRIASGMTQHQLASAAGVGRCFISQIERERFGATLETIGAIAAALGVSPAVLIQPLEHPWSRDLFPHRRLPERPSIRVAEAAHSGEPELVRYA